MLERQTGRAANEGMIERERAREKERANKRASVGKEILLQTLAS